MKKLSCIYSALLLLLSMLISTFFINPMPASAHITWGMGGAPTSNPYCQVYIHYVVKHLHISEATLLQAKLAAKKDVLAQLVREGKLTQTQADTNAIILTERLKSDPCY